MAKDKLTDYDATAANNTDVGGISVDEGMLPSNVNNAIREVMSHLKDFAAGTEAVDAIAVNGDLTVDTNTLHVDATNNRVGIGTSSPATALDVTGTVTADGLTVDGGAEINSNSLTLTGASPAFTITDSDTNVDHILSGASGVGNLLLSVDANNEGTSPKYIINIGGTERMRITSTGQVGIGTSSPSATLDLVSSGTNSQSLLDANSAGGIRAKIATDAQDDAYMYLYDSSDALKVAFRTDSNPSYIVGGGNFGIGTSSPSYDLDVSKSTSGAAVIGRVRNTSSTSGANAQLKLEASGNNFTITNYPDADTANANRTDFISTASNSYFSFSTNNAERMRIDSSGHVYIGTTGFSILSSTDTGIALFNNGSAYFVRDGGSALQIGRQTNDGEIIGFWQAGSKEGSITVSGTTVSYNGGHLARWSQLTDGTKDETIVKGTVMTNLDQMAVWSHDAVEAQDAVYDEDGNVVTEAVEAKEAYTEDNEQLNCMAVSSVEGDANVAGVFVNWDDDDDEFNDMNIAMTGDMVIRIAQGTTVARGDLLMSAGDGTAKPQGDDIVRSKTIAKVTSTNVSHTYDDGSYLVPCVLMAC